MIVIVNESIFRFISELFDLSSPAHERIWQSHVITMAMDLKLVETIPRMSACGPFSDIRFETFVTSAY